MTEQEVPERTGFDRRGFIKRAAVVGAATAWAAPTIQSLASPAFALGSNPNPGGCTACLTGGGEILGTQSSPVLFNGRSIPRLSFGVGQLCCTPPGNGNAEPQIEVNAHPRANGNGVLQSWHFDRNLQLTCSKSGNPAPPPNTADCANTLTGTAQDANGNTLTFTFQDNGEPGQMVDSVSISITGVDGTLSGTGLLSKGNLQIHAGLAGLSRDCSGC